MVPEVQALRIPQELLAVGAATELGLFHVLHEGPLSVTALADRLQADPRSLQVFCESLASLGYLVVEEGRVGLSQACRDLFFNEQSASYIGFSFMYDYDEIKSWLQLVDVVRTGKPIREKWSPAKRRLLMQALAHYAKPMVGAVVERCLADLPGLPEVLDVGGGTLAYARGFASRGARVTVLDLPPVVEEVLPQVAGESKIRLVPGDFRRYLPSGPYDLVFLGNVCRLYGEEENAALFKRVRAQLKPSGRVAVLDFVRGTSRRAALFDVNMLIHTPSGRTWTYNHFSRWLGEAGLGNINMYNLGERWLITCSIVADII